MMDAQNAHRTDPSVPARSADFVVELHRASAALSRANQLAEEPWRSMSGALLDAVIALEELVEDGGRTDA